MNKLNLLLYLNAYADSNPSNNPSRSNFKWTRENNSLLVNNPSSLAFSLAPGETKTLFNGSRSLTQDNTTQYSLAILPGQTSTYQLSWVGGTAPGFRTGRMTGGNGTSQVATSLNGTVLTFTTIAGQQFNLINGGVQVGDIVQLGNVFNTNNQGQYPIIALTANSFSVVNPLGAIETVVLGSGSQVDIFSAAGVQAGDALLISGGFSPVSQGTYIVSSVTDLYVQFTYTGVLPAEGPITTEDIAFYFDAQRLVYLESNQNVTMNINGNPGMSIMPIADCGCKVQPGVFLTMSIVYSMTVTNTSPNTASLFLASVE